MREVKSGTIFKTKSMSSIFKKMLFTEIGNANKDIFTPFMFAAAQASFDKFLWLRSETENGNFSFWYILMTSNVKIRLWNQHPIASQTGIDSQVLDLYRWHG